MTKKLLWKILLFIGLIPFIIILLYGIYSLIFGFTGLCLSCGKIKGLSAFVDSIIMISAIYWPLYIIGLILVVLSIYKLYKK